jgi:ribosomal protein L11 methyltransferase
MANHALVVKGTVALGEEVARLLRESGTLGIWEVSPSEWRAYFPAADSTLAASLGRSFPLLSWTWDTEAPVDWAARYQSSLCPIALGRRFVILPSPRLANPWPRRIPLRLVPGTAFGTGEHYTTASCLRLLESLRPVPPSVLDVGCGSGILAAAACSLGSREVVACDTDPEARRVARKTRAANAAAYRVRLGSASDVRGRYALVFANILAETLLEIIPDLKARTAPGGLLAGSGILLSKGEAVNAAAERTGFRLMEFRSDGAWATFLWRS